MEKDFQMSRRARALFIELPAFERYRADYWTDEDFQAFQQELLANPQAGEVIQGTGGLRKVRFADPVRQKGKRGGVRVIYYYWVGEQFWLFTIYDKDSKDDLTAREKDVLRRLLTVEIKARIR